MMKFGLSFRYIVAAVSLIFAAGCGGGGGSGGGNTGLSFLVPGAAGGGTALTVGDGSSNSLVLDSVEIVLREVEFKLEAGAEECNSPLADDDDCKEVEVGPLLVTLALDGSMQTDVKADLPAGLYDEVEFEIHKVSSDDDEDAAFLAAHPSFDGISIRVVGSFNGNSFEFTSDVDGEQQLEFSPPFEVVDGELANVTITIDVDSWFRDGTGALVDPATANVGGPNESLVESNIEKSIDAFEDDDRDGEDDHAAGGVDDSSGASD
jgi:hypothetical protein